MAAKARDHGKTTRRPYRKSRAIDSSCRSHGGYPWCAGARKYKNKRRELNGA